MAQSFDLALHDLRDWWPSDCAEDEMIINGSNSTKPETPALAWVILLFISNLQDKLRMLRRQSGEVMGHAYVVSRFGFAVIKNFKNRNIIIICLLFLSDCKSRCTFLSFSPFIRRSCGFLVADCFQKELRPRISLCSHPPSAVHYPQTMDDAMTHYRLRANIVQYQYGLSFSVELTEFWVSSSHSSSQLQTEPWLACGLF